MSGSPHVFSDYRFDSSYAMQLLTTLGDPILAPLIHLWLKFTNNGVRSITGDDFRIVKHVEFFSRVAPCVKHDSFFASGVIRKELKKGISELSNAEVLMSGEADLRW